MNVIAPGFHALYLEAMVKNFTKCSERTILKFENFLEANNMQGGKEIELDMEAEFSSLALDIIGLSVFNYDFGSVTKESPVIKAVYGTLFEAEHRSTFYIPYWKLPLAKWIVPRQRKFQKDILLSIIVLTNSLKMQRTRERKQMLKSCSRETTQIKGSLSFELRDDLMTMLIAGHETTAAVLTWAVFLLAQVSNFRHKAQAEIDLVLGQSTPTYESIKSLEYIRLIVVESLRLFPQPPLLIRRSHQVGFIASSCGCLLCNNFKTPFLSGLQSSQVPLFLDQPNEFEPERFLVKKSSPGIQGWAGYDPSRSPGALYPNEVISDFAFLPFGGGPRKCVGDQFALMESTVALAMLLQKFDVELRGSPESVELVTGATIHTKSGLWCKLRKRPQME
ncbi:unnamed protein product [Rhodiola kirilowii]